MCHGLFFLNKDRGFDTLKKIETCAKYLLLLNFCACPVDCLPSGISPRRPPKADFIVRAYSPWLSLNFNPPQHWRINPRNTPCIPVVNPANAVATSSNLNKTEHFSKVSNIMFAWMLYYPYFWCSRKEAQHRVRFWQIVCVKVGIPFDVFSRKTKKIAADNRR